MPHTTKGTPMSEVVNPEAPEAPEAPQPVEKIDEPLGAPGLEALRKEREARTAAETRLKEFEDRDKTEAERTAERLAAAEKRAAELEAVAARAEVAATKSVPSALLAGPASGSAEDLAKFADALIAFRGEPQAKGLRVPNEGKSPTPSGNVDRQFVRELFGGSD